MYVCMYVRTYVCMRIYIYTCIYIYIYIYKYRERERDKQLSHGYHKRSHKYHNGYRNFYHIILSPANQSCAKVAAYLNIYIYIYIYNVYIVYREVLSPKLLFGIGASKTMYHFWDRSFFG